jgi:hypothetical protein
VLICQRHTMCDLAPKTVGNRVERVQTNLRVSTRNRRGDARHAVRNRRSRPDVTLNVTLPGQAANCLPGDGWLGADGWRDRSPL